MEKEVWLRAVNQLITQPLHLLNLLLQPGVARTTQENRTMFVGSETKTFDVVDENNQPAGKMTQTSVTFCELVEHPGGHDGGEFPQDHTYGFNLDGCVFYRTDGPDSPTDTFSDEDSGTYNQVSTRSEALDVLRDERVRLVAGLKTLDDVIAAFEATPDSNFALFVPESEEDESEDDEDDD